MSIHPDRAKLVTAGRRDKADETPLPEIGSIHRARVTSIREFGAFVELVDGGGGRLQGLVHISELAQARVESVTDLVDVGELVWVKLIEVKESPRRLSFSMKYCDQGSGRDLDPNEVKLAMIRSGQRPERFEADPVTVGAVLDTTCTRCGVHGHTSKECFVDLSADRYDLIPDFPDQEDPVAHQRERRHHRPDGDVSVKKHKKKKHKHSDGRRDSRSAQRDAEKPKHRSGEDGDRKKGQRKDDAPEEKCMLQHGPHGDRMRKRDREQSRDGDHLRRRDRESSGDGDRLRRREQERSGDGDRLRRREQERSGDGDRLRRGDQERPRDDYERKREHRHNDDSCQRVDSLARGYDRRQYDRPSPKPDNRDHHRHDHAEIGHRRSSSE